MRMIIRSLILLILVFSLTIVLFAEETDPNANECFDGGTMAGQCNQDTNGDGVVSQEEIDWAWNCGWYMARFNDGSYGRGDVPLWCVSLLPSEIQASENEIVYTDCILLLGVNRVCLDGNSLIYDYGNDGSYDDVFYIVSDPNVGGPGGNCPKGTTYGGEMGSSVAALTNWLLNHGYQTSDDICW